MQQTAEPRKVGTVGATAIGVSAMLGAGVFSAFAPAAQAAGSWLLLSLGVALVVAASNAASTAQLARQHPGAGGVYLYGREQLGEWPGFLAGWGFVIGKTASVAAMAITAAAYLVPEPFARPVALAVLLAVTAAGMFGITRTAAIATIIAGVVMLGLVAVLVTAQLSPPLFGSASGSDAQFSASGVLQGAGILFFAFAGYARVATLSEEVRDPRRTVPRAMLLSFLIVSVILAMLGWALLTTLGPGRLALTPAPIAALVETQPAVQAVVGILAAVASIGALSAVLAGSSRTAMAMGRRHELPGPLARQHPSTSVPRVAVLAVAAGAALLICVGDIREVIGFSSAGVLVYYLVANLSALTQAREHRSVPRAVSALGALGCVVLVVTLPPLALASALGVFLMGVVVRLALRRRSDQG
ncbi:MULTISPECIES: APC family permease [unclassified Pseudoclavibacter]|uniref:APC family permease n=1 Tax=unclassified Pseudoclavibacter TaxID=2615177 RepID=UPI000CE78752|nr:MULTISPECIES: APC family permease [unclassified Pseudoclavibacter]PPF36615.1 amino acid permease [Pseudoclavibacter sp. AY1H1]PPF74578.1 amino acid permease [Pseudoclavibacter sp. Z016]